MKNLKKWARLAVKSKTMLFATLLAALSTAQLSLGVFTPYLSPEIYGIVCLVVAVLVAALRVVTNTPLKSQ